MPSFPRYQSKGELSTATPSVAAPENTDGKIAGELAKVGTEVQNATLKWSNAVDTIQKTTAEANFKTGMLDITQRASVDPDYNNSEQYFKEIEKLKTDSLKGFSSKTAETEAALSFGYDAKVGQIQIENAYKKKMIDVGQASTLKLIDTEVNNPTDSSLPNIQTLLNKQVGAGVLNHTDAYKLYQKANDDLGVNRINKDLYQATTPEQVDEVTQKITSGAYEKGGVTIDPDKKKSLLDIADRARTNTEKRVEAQQVEEMAQNRVATVVGVTTGQIDPMTADIASISEYDPKLGATLTKVKEFMKDYNPKVSKEEQRVSMAGVMTSAELKKVRSYANSVNEVFMTNNNEKLGDFVLRELEKHGDGTSSSVKLAAFMQLAALKVKANNPQTPEDREAVGALNAIKNGFRFIQSANPYLFPHAVSDFITKVFANGSSTKEQVMADARGSLESVIIDRYKSVSKLPSMPNKVVDGEASVEDLQDGLNELDGDEFSGDRADQPSD